MPISLDPGPSSDEIIRPENLNKLKEEINNGSNNGIHVRKNEKNDSLHTIFVNSIRLKFN